MCRKHLLGRAFKGNDDIKDARVIPDDQAKDWLGGDTTGSWQCVPLTDQSSWRKPELELKTKEQHNGTLQMADKE